MDEEDEEQDSRRQPSLRRRDGMVIIGPGPAVHYSKVVVVASALRNAVNAHHLQGDSRPAARRRSLRAVHVLVIFSTFRVSRQRQSVSEHDSAIINDDRLSFF